MARFTTAGQPFGSDSFADASHDEGGAADSLTFHGWKRVSIGQKLKGQNMTEHMHIHSEACAETRDPVCGMMAKTDGSKPTSRVDDRDFFFCGNGCKTKFDADTQFYLTRTTQDLVCGMDVKVANAKYALRHNKKSYYFCSATCETKFEKEPERYTGETPAPAPAPVPEGTMYTCPMDPEIRQIGPGTCPICGMALEPDMPRADAGPNPEYIDFLRRLILAGPLVLPIVILEMGSHVGGFEWMPPFMSGLIQLAFALPIVAWAGRPFFERGWCRSKRATSICSRSLPWAQAWPLPIASWRFLRPDCFRMRSIIMMDPCRSILKPLL